MGHYTPETQKILERFLDALHENDNINPGFTEQIAQLIAAGKFTDRKAIAAAVAELKKGVADES